MRAPLLLTAAATLALAACGPTECQLDQPNPCGGTDVCEPVQGGTKALCFHPVTIQGKVFDLESQAALEGAAVTALDENGAPVASVATTDFAGKYSIVVPAVRADEKGTPVGKKVSLRAAAQDHVSFPSGIRQAIPVDVATATQKGSGDPWVLETPATDIGLLALVTGDRGRPSIRGTVDLGTAAKSALVVADDGAGGAGHSAIADSSGAFVIFNVPAGSYVARAYAQGVSFTPVNVMVAAADVDGVHLVQDATPTATVTGTITVVATTGVTSVILVVKSTFDVALGRGEAVAGLRAPSPGIAPNIGNGQAFSIAGVPDGEYAVLAGFENDGMVRDPDTSLGGTAIQYVTVSGGTASTLSTFKVTDAIQMVGPGADKLEVVAAPPTFVWARYPSTSTYHLTVIDALGNKLWETDIPGAGGGNLTQAYQGPTLAAGGIYQWWVDAIAVGGNTLSRTEDLRGVFQIGP